MCLRVSRVFSHRPNRRLSAIRRSRRAVTSVELVLVLVVLILATLVTFQFGIALIVKQAVAHAATVAARQAAKANPPDLMELQCDIERVLAGHQITIGPNASFVLENPAPQPQQGGPICTPPATPVLDADEVRVTICVNLTAHPILNIFQAYGIDYTGRTFTISAVATRE